MTCRAVPLPQAEDWARPYAAGRGKHQPEVAALLAEIDRLRGVEGAWHGQREKIWRLHRDRLRMLLAAAGLDAALDWPDLLAVVQRWRALAEQGVRT